jgi:2-succinyl-6-hydroxy-2,4-cyclohexadiene-1-carboxylate synthase
VRGAQAETLHAEAWGQGDPVVLVHGFTQSGRTWREIATDLATGHQVIALDAPGHGGSSEVVTDLPGGADLMAAAAPNPAAWLGYSMGGRYALHVALRHPRLVRRLVLVSTSGGIDDDAERESRRKSDEVLAHRVLAEGLGPFVRWWLERPLFSTLSAEAAAMESRLDGTPAGLASSLRHAGAGAQEPLWDQLGELAMPVLVVAGALDVKYVNQAGRLVAAIGSNAELAVLPGAGHACHMERPEAFWSAVTPFLDRADPA